MIRGVVPGGAGSAMAHPDFGRSVNPISTRGYRLCSPNYYWHPRIFRPSDGPDDCIKSSMGKVEKKDTSFKNGLMRKIYRLFQVFYSTCFSST